MIGDLLSWLADEGLGDFFAKYGIDYRSAPEFRARHTADALASVLKASAWR